MLILDLLRCPMRTTLTIDDGIARALKDLAHRSNKPFKQVVNETLRAGLSAPAASKSKPYRVKPAALGGGSPGINLDKALVLADAIEDQELATKMQLRK
ncbi:MAG TPA: hypothetical protein VFY19_08120 [Geminicoccaceae bacterium]|nr:hypothetical protein [Geminicoccaceae bacterium]